MMEVAYNSKVLYSEFTFDKMSFHSKEDNSDLETTTLPDRDVVVL